MAEFVLTNAQVVINSVDLSDHVRSVTIDYSAETPDATTMGALAKRRLPGLLDWKVDIELNQDFAASSVDATLFPLVGAAAFPISILPVNSSVASTNPNYNGNCLLATYPPLGGNVGEVATAKCSFVGSGVLNRSTS